MKNFLVIFVNLGLIAFFLCAVGTFLNYLFSWHLGYKGNELPNDPMIGAVFVVTAGIFGAAAFFVNRKSETAQSEES